VANEDQAFEDPSDVSENMSDRDSCVDEVLESDDPDLRPTQGGRAMAQKLASEVS
jgi:hypothetical protein